MLRIQALHALGIASLQDKLQATEKLDPQTPLDCQTELPEPSWPLPGRPVRPLLVPATELPKRGMRSVQGRATLLHALAHIEFNAINLALDIVWRFAGMPEAFYRAWITIAKEEARHFCMLQERLQALGFTYGDFSAHNGLWEMAEKTKSDLLARLALVPCTLEARGLDVTPAMRDKLAQAGDLDTAAVLDTILHDEIGHVAAGKHWYDWMCTARAQAPLTTYTALAQRYRAPVLRGPFNLQARRAAGFGAEELAALQAAST